jgi:hypothetical protein
MSIINTIQSAYGSVPAYQPMSKNGRKAGAEVPPLTKGDNIELSASSKEYQKLYEVIAQMEETRIPVVREIKARIKISDYPIENSFNEALRKMVDNRIL